MAKQYLINIKESVLNLALVYIYQDMIEDENIYIMKFAYDQKVTIHKEPITNRSHFTILLNFLIQLLRNYPSPMKFFIVQPIMEIQVLVTRLSKLKEEDTFTYPSWANNQDIKDQIDELRTLLNKRLMYVETEYNFNPTSAFFTKKCVA